MRIANSVVAGLLTLACAASAVAQEVEHYPTIEKASEAAKKNKRDIIVDFTGSDWCGWCIKLVEEVFATDEWKKGAAAKYVFVELDFPKAKSVSAEQKKYNEEKMKLFGVQGYPTILVLDSEGKLYARTGYEAGGPGAYLKHLEAFAPRKKELAELRKTAKDGTGKGRLDALFTLTAKLAEWELDEFYIEVKEEAVTADTANASGKRAAWAKELALVHHRRGNKEKKAAFAKIARDTDPAVGEGLDIEITLEDEVMPILNQRKWAEGIEKLKPILEKKPKGHAGQLAYYYAGMASAYADDKDKAVEYLQASIDAAPESELAPNIQKHLDKLK